MSAKRVTKKNREIFKSFWKLNQIFDETKNPINCDYYNTDGVNKVKINQQNFYILHLNIFLLTSHINDLKTVISNITIRFNIICISKSRWSQNKLLGATINIPGNKVEHTLTEF